MISGCNYISSCITCCLRHDLARKVHMSRKHTIRARFRDHSEIARGSRWAHEIARDSKTRLTLRWLDTMTTAPYTRAKMCVPAFADALFSSVLRYTHPPCPETQQSPHQGSLLQHFSKQQVASKCLARHGRHAKDDLPSCCLRADRYHCLCGDSDRTHGP